MVSKTQKIFTYDKINNTYASINGILYYADVLDKAIQKYLLKETYYGEYLPTTNPTLTLENISHKINEIIKKDDDYYIDYTILDTPRGSLIQKCCLVGTDVICTPRCYGERINDIIKVDEIITFDIMALDKTEEN